MIEEDHVLKKAVLVININLTKQLATLLTVGILLAAFTGYLVMSQRPVTASDQQNSLASSIGMRQFYLTKNIYKGAEATGTDGNGAGVCAVGYHFASMWELLDPSSLIYNTFLGRTYADSGQGPPSGQWGWVRTGYDSSSTDTVGTGNCDSWTSTAGIRAAPQAKLDYSWDTPGTFPGWDIENTYCDLNKFVWCVED